MNEGIRAPFFEIGPKNLLRRAAIEDLARAAGEAGREFGVSIVLTVPTAYIAPVRELGTGVHVFAQGIETVSLGDSMNQATAESLVDAGATGVMLNHERNPLDDDALAAAMARARDVGLETIVCAGSETDAARFAAFRPTVVLFEPPELIGTAGSISRPWISASTRAIRASGPGVLAMHAGGVSTPDIADQIMTAGADGTGSTSGIISAEHPSQSARAFIAATRAGWDRAQGSARPTDLHRSTKREKQS